MDEIIVYTRKGLFVYKVENKDLRLSSRHFLGDPVSAFAKDNQGNWYAALNLGHFGPKMHRSQDQGETWEEVGCPALPQKPEGSKDDSEWDVKQVWTLETDSKEQIKLWAGTVPGALFSSIDKGDSWQLNEPLWQVPERVEWFGGGFDQTGLHSIAINSIDSQKITIAISVGGVWHTQNGGVSWQLACSGMQANYLPDDMQQKENLQDPHRLVQSSVQPSRMWVQHHCGIYTSDDHGKSWRSCEPQNSSSFGFAVAVHPLNPDAAWFIPAINDDVRYPVDGALSVSKTTDGGLTFSTIRTGLPQVDAYDLIYRHALDVDSSGERLIFGSTTGNLRFSFDSGESWQLISSNLPPIYGLKFYG